MGSSPRGTLCAYCGVHPACYIPDGCIGPICFSPPTLPKLPNAKRMNFEWDGCWDIAQELGWHFVDTEYIKRCWRAKIGSLRQANHQLRNFDQEISVIIASFLFWGNWWITLRSMFMTWSKGISIPVWVRSEFTCYCLLRIATQFCVISSLSMVELWFKKIYTHFSWGDIWNIWRVIDYIWDQLFEHVCN